MFLDIGRRAELLDWAERISDLYAAVYGKPLDRRVWSWFYIDNPNGDPVVRLYIEGGRLVGHYATIPTRLIIDGRPAMGHRSMTTMVHPDLRGRGLFYELASRAYETLEAMEVPVVYGFPNQNSAPIFAGRLGWILPAPDVVADLSGAQIRASGRLASMVSGPQDVRWDSQDDAQMQWRIRHPTESAAQTAGLVVKLYAGRRNLLHAEGFGLENLQADEIYRLLVPEPVAAELPAEARAFNYQFGYRCFGQAKRSDQFKRELILSDVF
jgi:hypothetical protein